MLNLQTLTARARELRGNVVSAISTRGSRTMTPVYDREEQRKLRERIQQTQPEWLLLWWGYFRLHWLAYQRCVRPALLLH